MKHRSVMLIHTVLIGICVSNGQYAIMIHASGGTEYVVTDPLQKRAGFNPITGKRFREINNSYGEFSVDSEDPEIDPPEPVNEFMTDIAFNGTYQITLFGTKLAFYRLSIIIHEEKKGKAAESSGIIDSGQTRLFTFDYVNDSTALFIVKRVISGSILQEDISNCFRLKFLGNQSLYKEFTEHADKIDKCLEKGDSSKAAEELEKLGDKLKKAREETMKHEERKQKPNRFVTAEAYSVLNEDITSLAASLGESKKKGQK